MVDFYEEEFYEHHYGILKEIFFSDFGLIFLKAEEIKELIFYIEKQKKNNT